MRTIQHKFVEFIPADLDGNILYISMQYKSVVHLCICGCGNKVVTPLSPSGWKLTFDGKSISLYPSIGNWSFACRSHYWIKNSRIEGAEPWTDDEVWEARRLNSKDVTPLENTTTANQVHANKITRELPIQFPTLDNNGFWRKMWLSLKKIFEA